MARFGISGIIAKEKKGVKLITKQRIRGQRIPVWNGNITFNFKKEAQQLINGKESVHNYIDRLYKKGEAVITEAEGFISNGMLVFLNKLYPGREKYFVIFMKYGYDMYLLTLGSKTIHEFRVAGHDSFLKSRVPLILTIINENGAKRLDAVNLQPELREDETYKKK